MAPTSTPPASNPAFSYAISLLPPGIAIPSFEDMKATDNVKPSIVQVNAVFLSLVCVTCVARLWVRLVMVRGFGLDDGCMVLACACAVVMSIMCLNSLNHGFGQHIWMISLLQVIPMTMRVVQNLIVVALMYSTSMTSIKLSIILSYLRLFPIPRFRHFLFLLSALILALWFTTIWVVMFQCKPIHGAWDFTITKRKCIPVVRYFYFSAGVNIVTDVALCTVPLPLLLGMRLPRRQKAGVCALFAAGGFACVASILRLCQLHNLLGIDITYTSASSLNWSIVETGTSIVCASIPCLKPLWILIVPSRWRSKNLISAAGAGGGTGGRGPGATPTWGSGGNNSRGRKLSKAPSSSSSVGGGLGSVVEDEFPLHELSAADEEMGIKKTVAVGMTVDVAGVQSLAERDLDSEPVVFARAYSREEDGREASNTWVDSLEELVQVVVPHPDMELVRQGRRVGGRGEEIVVPQSVYSQ